MPIRGTAIGDHGRTGADSGRERSPLAPLTLRKFLDLQFVDEPVQRASVDPGSKSLVARLNGEGFVRPRARRAGEEVVIARNPEPVVRLVREAPPKKKRLLGAMKGRFELSDAFFEPLPDEKLRAWGLK